LTPGLEPVALECERDLRHVGMQAALRQQRAGQHGEH
jgi:hypothetical protein